MKKEPPYRMLEIQAPLYEYPTQHAYTHTPRERVLLIQHNNSCKPYFQMIHRLKTRLALANFKRQHGYEKYDLHTLESNLLLHQHKRPKKQDEPPPNYYRRYYHPSPPQQQDDKMPPAAAVRKVAATRSTPLYPLSAKRSTSPRFPHKRPLSSSSSSTTHNRQHRATTVESTSPPIQHPTEDINPIPFSSDEEDAANLLVMLHHHHHA